MGKERYTIQHYCTPGDAVIGGQHTTIIDKDTNNKASAWGRDKEEAKENAWDKLERMQGPTPSKR